MISESAEILFESVHAALLYDRPRARVILQRSRAPIPEATLRAEIDVMLAALAGIAVDATDLIVDVRAPVGRNDESFEDAVRVLMRDLFGRFRRTAILVRSAVGRLQGQRLVGPGAAVGRGRVLVTDDLAALERFLAEPAPS